MEKFQDIFEFDSVKSIEKITKGWSFDSKYIVTMNDDEKRTLRVSDIKNYDSKLKEYQMIEKVYSMGIKTHKPIYFGVCANDTLVYYLIEYIEGEQAEDILPSLDKETKYKLGFEMGSSLKKIHTIDYQETSNWEEVYKKKITQRIEAYNNCGYRSTIVEEMITYVNNNLDLLKGRPSSFNHGDFHSGNMIISPENEIYTIDFNRIKYADPLYDFNRIYFSFRISKTFTKGLLDGYFGEITERNFKYIKFYLISVVIANVAWAMMFGEDDVQFAKEGILRVYEEYNGLVDDIPNWYKEIDTSLSQL